MTHERVERSGGQTREHRTGAAPPRAAPTGALALQRSVGNQAVAGLLARQEAAGGAAGAPPGGLADDQTRLDRIDRQLGTYDAVYLANVPHESVEDKYRRFTNWTIDLLTAFEMFYDGSPHPHDEVPTELNAWFGLTHDATDARVDSALNAMVQLRDVAAGIVRNFRTLLGYNRDRQPNERLWNDQLTYRRDVVDRLLGTAAENRRAIEQGLSTYDAMQQRAAGAAQQGQTP